jgi:ATP-dependent protease Clp ATPase subunit
MKGTLCCSFCGKPQGRISKLVFARKGHSGASICDECLEVCRKILVKSGTAPIVDSSNLDSSNNDSPKSDLPKSYYRIGQQPPERGRLGCSFCGASQENVHRLIGSPKHLQPAYICDKCVARGDAASDDGNTSSFARWFARKMGRHETSIGSIE